MSLTSEERDALIRQYREGYDAVIAALDGITEDEWESREGPEEWNARQIVHHLGDSEMNAAGRLRMLVADADPLVVSYDERRWTDNLYTDKRPIDLSLAAFRASRDATTPLLELMTDADWARSGRHSERGSMTAETWLEWYGPHGHVHADQIRRARRGSF